MCKAVDDKTSGQLGVQIDSPAREGEANERLCDFLSEVRKTSLQTHQRVQINAFFTRTETRLSANLAGAPRGKEEEASEEIWLLSMA